VQLVSKISNLYNDHIGWKSWSTNVTDGRTDGRTDDMQSQYRALHYSASRGKNSTTAWLDDYSSCRCTTLYHSHITVIITWSCERLDGCDCIGDHPGPGMQPREGAGELRGKAASKFVLPPSKNSVVPHYWCVVRLTSKCSRIRLHKWSWLSVFGAMQWRNAFTVSFRVRFRVRNRVRVTGSGFEGRGGVGFEGVERGWGAPPIRGG